MRYTLCCSVGPYLVVCTWRVLLCRRFEMCWKSVWESCCQELNECATPCACVDACTLLLRTTFTQVALQNSSYTSKEVAVVWMPPRDRIGTTLVYTSAGAFRIRTTLGYRNLIHDIAPPSAGKYHRFSIADASPFRHDDSMFGDDIVSSSGVHPPGFGEAKQSVCSSSAKSMSQLPLIALRCTHAAG